MCLRVTTIKMYAPERIAANMTCRVASASSSTTYTRKPDHRDTDKSARSRRSEEDVHSRASRHEEEDARSRPSRHNNPFFLPAKPPKDEDDVRFGWAHREDEQSRFRSSHSDDNESSSRPSHRDNT